MRLMKNMEFEIPVITVNEEYMSIINHRLFTKEERNGLIISPRIDAMNFRIRESIPGYQADWHMAGDPTFIAIQQGVLRIILRDGQYFDFGAGSCFIAADSLPENISFDAQKHGHKASVIGNEVLKAIHIKLHGFSAK